MRLTIIFLLLSNTVFGENTKIAETSASFLRMGVGARPLGLGSAFFAVAEGPEALYWNTAGLSYVKRNSLTLMFDRWVEDTSHSFLGYAKPFYSGGMGFGLIWLDLGEEEKRDEDGVLLPDKLKPYDIAYIAGFGFPLLSGISLGSSLVFIQEKMYEDKTEGWSLSSDFLYVKEGIRIGLGIKNLGKGIKGFSLPKEAKIGIAYKGNDEDEGFLFSTDITIAEDSNNKINVGTEYQCEPFSLRMGYEQLFKREGLTRLGFRGGFGIKIKELRIDYALITQGVFGNSSCLSISN